jgi:anti-sigma regulatory factor (Ser/Thr protein kinase)
MPKTQAPAKLENLVILQKFITDFAGTQGFSVKRIFEIELACEEALVNIINYAYSNENRGNVEINCTVDQKGDCIIELIDNGPPFDLRLLPDPDINENITERRIGGMGTLLIKKFSDEIKYHRLQNKNFLALKFYKQD